jgi:3',5'-nucleoside bisphosphate phosphatase
VIFDLAKTVFDLQGAVIDLHSHTAYSDGSLSPVELVARAKERGVSVLAITDHDTIAALEIAHKAAQEAQIKLINGIEFSSQWGRSQSSNTAVHIVGLDIDLQNENLHRAIAQQKAARDNRSIAIAERLHKLGFHNTLESVRTIAGEADVARPHFAQHLVNIGAVKNSEAAFKKYLGRGKPADVNYQWPDMREVIHWIHAADGIAVLAHPAKYELTRMKMCALIDAFATAGGEAIEVINGAQEKARTDDLAKIANHYSLYASCGSDFHNPTYSWQELGQFGSLPSSVKPVWELFRS